MVKAARINIFDSDDMKKQIEEYLEQTLRITARLIRDDLYITATWAMAAFYSDYTPKKYYRYYKNFLGGNSFAKYYASPKKGVYYAGIKFTSDRMKPVYQDSTTDVFESVFSGYHGPKGTKVVHVMSPSPYDLIYNRRDYIVDHIGDFVSKAQSMISFW